jgi:Ca2+-binding EF-hand superfamily protein
MLKELQRAKADIVLSCLDFNLFDAFRLVDIRGQGNITQQDLLNSFQLHARHQIDGEETRMNLPHVSSDEIALFFKRWDKDVDGRLKFSEFTEAFTPFDN